MMDDFKRAQEMYDRQAELYSQQTNANENLRHLRNLVYELFTPVADKRYLSVGCGDGTECVPFSKNGGNVVGIDASKNLITLAKSNYSELDIDFFVMDFEYISFEDHSFDGILSIKSIMYKNDLVRVLLEMIRVLKPMGTLVIVVQHPIRKMVKYSNFEYFASGLRYETWKDVTRFNYYRTLEEYFQLITATGLIVKKILEPKPKIEFPVQEVNNIPEDLYPHDLIFVLQTRL